MQKKMTERFKPMTWLVIALIVLVSGAAFGYVSYLDALSRSHPVLSPVSEAILGGGIMMVPIFLLALIVADGFAWTKQKA